MTSAVAPSSERAISTETSALGLSSIVTIQWENPYDIEKRRMDLNVEELFSVHFRKADIFLPNEWGKVAILQRNRSSFIPSSWSPPKYRSASLKAA